MPCVPSDFRNRISDRPPKTIEQSPRNNSERGKRGGGAGEEPGASGSSRCPASRRRFSTHRFRYRPKIINRGESLILLMLGA